jgi:hypothetical protein
MRATVLYVKPGPGPASPRGAPTRAEA